MTEFAKGDAIIVDWQEQKFPGIVRMISDNQVGAILEFDGRITRHLGMMPAMRLPAKEAGRDDVFRSIIDDTEVSVRKLFS